LYTIPCILNLNRHKKAQTKAGLHYLSEIYEQVDITQAYLTLVATQ
jgi:hypothetical protein